MPTLPTIGLVLLLGSVCLAAQMPPARFTLTSSEVKATIEVDTDRLANEFGPRFDQSAQIVSLIFDGDEWLDSRGMPDEFGLDGNGVLGWESDGSTLPFVKMGVALLKRVKPGPYRFYNDYRIEIRFQTAVHATASEIQVTQEGSSGRGDAYRLGKSYRLLGSDLEISYSLANRGSRPLTFEHYNHHFLRLGENPVGRTRVTVSPHPTLPPPPDWTWQDERLALTRRPSPAASAYWGWDLRPHQTSHFTVHRPGGASLRVIPSTKIRRFAVWSDGAALCPELFAGFELSPGEQAVWSVNYHFQKSPAP